MFLSACKRSWRSCAKGHFHRLTVSRYNNNNNNNSNNTTVHFRWLNTLKTSCWSFSNRTCGSCRPVPEPRSPELNKPSIGLHLRHAGAGFTAALRLCGSSGFCTDASRKSELEDKYLKQDPRENGEDPAASSPANEGHFQFKELYENPWTIPNYLCMARIVLSPVLGYLIMEQYFHVSLGLFALAGATDLLDGYIARIDGTWSQARDMFLKNTLLQLPRQVQLCSAPSSQYVIRTQPNNMCVSTLECAAVALSVLENDRNIQEVLLRPLRALCSFQLQHGAQVHHSKEQLIRSGEYKKSLPRNKRKIRRMQKLISNHTI